jgi:hypothetical protein
VNVVRPSVAILILVLNSASICFAGDGFLGMDHRVAYDNSGIWARSHQRQLEIALLATEGGMALWEGGDTRLGKTAWQSVDSTLVSTVSVTLMKLAFSRVRPVDSADPNLWFKGHGNSSFPSGEATLSAAVVTPFILEYRKDYPLVYALALIPAYDATGRVKTWGHWQSDVLAGVALGAGIGYLMHERDVPLSFSVLPHGFQVGLKKRW